MTTSAIPHELQDIQDQLKAVTMEWAANRKLDEPKAAWLRRRAAVVCHDHYRRHIPYYREVCDRMGVDGPASYETIVDRLLVPDDIFKSYPQRFLDEGRYDEMNRWISKISSHDIDFDTSGIGSIDQWLERLEVHGLKLVFSSGTSGHISFVPRDEETWRNFTELPFLYAAAQLDARGVLPRWKSLLVKGLANTVEPSSFAWVVQQIGLRSLDGFFFNFAGGNQGVQLVGQEMGKLTRKAHFLYEKKMSAAAVRGIVRGPRNDEEKKLVDDFLDTTVRRKEENYRRLIRALEKSVRQGHRVMLFGTPALMMEVCEMVAKTDVDLKLPEGSSCTYGGGWKSFTGTRIPEEQLNALLARTFGLEPVAISEGYSMTEINGLMYKCTCGRYHIPPFLEPVIYGEDLTVKQGDDVQGTLGFLDPFATSYPGFILTGDNVRLRRDPCACGVPGPTILKVERSPGKDVKGCGGIMATVNA